MLNGKFLTRFFLVSLMAITSSLTINKIASAEGVKFFCANNDKGQPSSFASSGVGDIAMINWQTELGGGFTPQKRCEMVSEKFQNFYDRGILHFLTTGYILSKSGNSINFICPATSEGGGCVCLKSNNSNCEEYEILYTLKPGDNPSSKLQQLMDLRLGASGPINETNKRIYIDMNQYFREAIPVTYIPQPLNNQTPEVRPSSINNRDLFFNSNVNK